MIYFLSRFCPSNKIVSMHQNCNKQLLFAWTSQMYHFVHTYAASWTNTYVYASLSFSNNIIASYLT